jgi:hypothetical protein
MLLPWQTAAAHTQDCGSSTCGSSISGSKRVTASLGGVSHMQHMLMAAAPAAANWQLRTSSMVPPPQQLHLQLYHCACH